MIFSAYINNIFTGYKIGWERTLSIFHLQFANDTFILGERSWANVRAMRAILYLFAAMSGMKVNFHKIELVGVNVSRTCLLESASILNCKVKSLPVLNLDIPVDGDPRRLNF